MLVALAIYRAFIVAPPIDLVPDFFPVVGQLDDAIVVAHVLRRILRTSERETVAHCWPGPPQSPALVLRLAARPGSA